MMSLGRRSAGEHVHHQLAGRRSATSALLGVLGAGPSPEPIGEMPSTSNAMRHRVGGELAAAGAGAGAGGVLELAQLLVGHLAGGVGADRLEDVLDRDVARRCSGRARSSRRRASRRGGRAARAPSRRRGSSCRSRRARRRASKRWPRATSSIESAITSRLTSERLHALGAHRDAVGDRDRVELHRRAAGGADALLDLARRARAGGSCTASSRSRCWRRR